MAKFAQEKVAPLVKEMDEKEELDRSIIDGLFEQGVSDASIVTLAMISRALLVAVSSYIWFDLGQISF